VTPNLLFINECLGLRFTNMLICIAY